jgi:chromosome partitioning protein
MVDTALARPTIVVLGNHKGGSGKSTLAMHIIVAFLKAGMRVASIDLDREQQSLTRYIENRRKCAEKCQIELDLPTHHSAGAFSATNLPSTDPAGTAALRQLLSVLEHDHDVIVVDTPGGSGQLSLLAHALADTLITPINDSFLDLDVIYSPGSEQESSAPRSPYAQTVAAAIAARKRVTGRPIDWIVVRNRLSPLGSRNDRDVLKALEGIAERAGFRIVSGLLERVAYREFFPVGLTAFDSLEASILGVKASISHLLARNEVTSLVNSLNVLHRTGEEPAPPRSKLEKQFSESENASPSVQFELVDLEIAKTRANSKAPISGTE